MTQAKPVARRYIAKGVWDNQSTCWRAQFAWPGQNLHYVRNDAGWKLHYATEAEAEEAAGIALARKLVDRAEQPTGKGTMEVYDRITGPEIAVKLAELNITPTFFAEIAGISLQRLREFIDGMNPAPHYIRVLLALFEALPGALDIAEDITQQFSRSRREAKKEKEVT